MTTLTKDIETIIFRRARITYGVTLLGFGLFIFLVFGLNTPSGVLTTFGLNLAGSQAISVPDLVLPSQMLVFVMAGIAAFFGAFQLSRGIRATGWLVGVIALTFVISFLTWAAADKSFNLTGMLSSSLVRATPIALAAL
jgi:general nucleoside transport system permease protein